MKSKFAYIGLMALLVSACSTGSYVTNSYTDDIYFNPADVPPPIASAVVSNTATPVTKSGNTVIVNEISENEENSGSVNNFGYEADEQNAGADEYIAEQDFDGTDTITYYEDGEMKQLIDNYYTDDYEVDYAYRIQRFHNPYFYDPFYWDSWHYDPFYYDPWGWSMSFNYGWGYPYYGWGYSHYGWGYPYYGWGNSYYGWGYPGYGWGYYQPYWGGGYYSGYPGYHNSGYNNPDRYQYGQRRSGGTSVARNDLRGSTNDGSVRASARDKSAVSGETRESVSGSSRRENSVSGVRSGTQTAQSETKSSRENNAVLTERRRTAESGANNNTRPAVVNNQAGRNTTQSYIRPSTQTRSYTRPGNSITGNTQPRVVNKSSVTNSSGQTYSQPRSTSNYNQTYRSSSTYNRSTSNGVSSRTYRAPSVSSGSNSYRGSSSGNSSSYSSGSSSSRSSSGSYSSGSSGGGSSSSGSSSGGGRSSGGGSSSSGRR